ncbi:MAG: V-type ATP synthase subunit D [Candidatus Delongbacteria bacterium]|nr:V-type ATP synthase subunit D [Candidatus Delongbacteria bacterium]
MAIKFQYNKTSLHELNKQLRVRLRALPTLQNKESALRMEVKKAKDKADEYRTLLQDRISEYQKMVRLWVEYDPELVRIDDVRLSSKKIAGVQTPILEEVLFSIKPISLFNQPDWTMEGIRIIQGLARVAIEREFFMRKMHLLDYARRKTTQKVNLYEKVQIPGYDDAIRKIKRFLEDEENLSKSAQKIVKNRSVETGVAS